MRLCLSPDSATARLYCPQIIDWPAAACRIAETSLPISGPRLRKLIPTSAPCRYTTSLLGALSHANDVTDSWEIYSWCSCGFYLAYHTKHRNINKFLFSFKTVKRTAVWLKVLTLSKCREENCNFQYAQPSKRSGKREIDLKCIMIGNDSDESAESPQ